MKRLSILIPVYNVERYLGRCLDSVYRQLPADCEVVLVDDGSTDGSGAICDEYEAKFASCTKVLHKTNGGVASARNTLLDSAQGRYVWFVDSDDFIENGSVEKIVSAVAACDEPDVLSFAYRNCDDTSFSEWQNAYELKSAINGAEYLNTYRMNPYLWSNVYRRECINQEGLRFDERLCIGEDSLFNIKVYASCKTIALTDIPAYNYYTNPDSTLHRPTIEAKRRNAKSTVIGIGEFSRFMQSKRDFEAYEALRNWQNYGVAGFLHAQVVDHLPISEIRGFIKELERIGVYPIAATGNKKADLFRLLANCKPMFLLACRVHSWIY